MSRNIDHVKDEDSEDEDMCDEWLLNDAQDMLWVLL